MTGPAGDRGRGDRPGIRSGDWASLAARANVGGWTAAAAATAALILAGAFIAHHALADEGEDKGREEAILIDLAPPSPALLALPPPPPPAPEAEPEKLDQPEPDAAPEQPAAEDTPELAELEEMEPDLSEALPEPVIDPLPLPEPEPKPEPKPDPKPEPKPKPKAKEKAPEKPKAEKPKKKAAQAPAPNAPEAQPAAKASAPLPKGREQDLKAKWGNGIRARVQRRSASSGAGRGTVTVGLTVSRSGQLSKAWVSASSGNAKLDAAAVKAVKSAAPFKAAPEGLTDSSYSFSLPITFD